MAFEGLTEKLSSAFKKLRNKGRLTFVEYFKNSGYEGKGDAV